MASNLYLEEENKKNYEKLFMWTMLKAIQYEDHQQSADALKRMDWKTLEEILHIFIIMYFLLFIINNFFFFTTCI